MSDTKNEWQTLIDDWANKKKDPIYDGTRRITSLDFLTTTSGLSSAKFDMVQSYVEYILGEIKSPSEYPAVYEVSDGEDGAEPTVMGALSAGFTGASTFDEYLERTSKYAETKVHATRIYDVTLSDIKTIVTNPWLNLNQCPFLAPVSQASSALKHASDAGGTTNSTEYDDTTFLVAAYKYSLRERGVETFIQLLVENNYETTLSEIYKIYKFMGLVNKVSHAPIAGVWFGGDFSDYGYHVYQPLLNGASHAEAAMSLTLTMFDEKDLRGTDKKAFFGPLESNIYLRIAQALKAEKAKGSDHVIKYDVKWVDSTYTIQDSESWEGDIVAMYGLNTPWNIIQKGVRS